MGVLAILYQSSIGSHLYPIASVIGSSALSSSLSIRESRMPTNSVRDNAYNVIWTTAITTLFPDSTVTITTKLNQCARKINQYVLVKLENNPLIFTFNFFLENAM